MGRIRRNTNRWRFQLFPTLVFTGLGAIIGAVTTPIGPLQWQGIVGTAAIGLIVGIVLGGFVRKGSRNRG